MSKYLLFSFSFLFMPFFLTSLVAIFFFFHLPFAFIFFFFSSCLFFLELSCFSSFFLFFFCLGGLVSTVVFLLFSFLLSGGTAFCFSCFWLLFLFFFCLGRRIFSSCFRCWAFSCFFLLGALCFLSLLPSSEQAAWNRFYVLSRFSDRLFDTRGISRNHAMNMPSPWHQISL